MQYKPRQPKHKWRLKSLAFIIPTTMEAEKPAPMEAAEPGNQISNTHGFLQARRLVLLESQVLYGIGHAVQVKAIWETLGKSYRKHPAVLLFRC